MSPRLNASLAWTRTHADDACAAAAALLRAGGAEGSAHPRLLPSLSGYVFLLRDLRLPQAPHGVVVTTRERRALPQALPATLHQRLADLGTALRPLLLAGAPCYLDAHSTAQAWPYCPGPTPSWTRTLEAVTSWHELALSPAERAALAPWSPLARLDTRLAHLERSGGEPGDIDLVRRLRPLLGDVLAAPSLLGADVLLHADLHPRNAVPAQTRAGAVLIDYERACLGPPEADLLRLRARVEIGASSPQLLSRALRAYARRRDLDPELLRRALECRVPVILATSLCSVEHMRLLGIPPSLPTAAASYRAALTCLLR